VQMPQIPADAGQRGSAEVRCGVGMLPGRLRGEHVQGAMPVGCRSNLRWSRGFSHQEAAQADGEEEAPQAAAQDAGSAQEQEVTRLPAAGESRPGGRKYRGPRR